MIMTVDTCFLLFIAFYLTKFQLRFFSLSFFPFCVFFYVYAILVVK